MKTDSALKVELILCKRCGPEHISSTWVLKYDAVLICQWISNVPEEYAASIFNPEYEGSTDRTTNGVTAYTTITINTHRRKKTLSNITRFYNN